MSMTDLDLDSPGVGIRVAAQLVANVQTLAQRVAEHTGRVEQLVRQAGELQPVYAKVFDADVWPGSGNLVLDLGGPQQGRQWQVRRLVAGAKLPSTSVSINAYFYATAARDTDVLGGAISVADWIDTMTVTAAPPVPGYYGDGQVVVQPNERLLCMITGGVASTYYEAAAAIIDTLVSPTTRNVNVG